MLRLNRETLHSLLPFIIVTSLAAALASFFTQTTVRSPWYKSLLKPSWILPSQLFAPIWTLLYALMAIAAWKVWKKKGWHLAQLFFIVQLILNAFWPACFFVLKSPLWGAYEITALLIAVIITQGAFWREDRSAGWLFLPYTAWGLYATALTWTIWRMNQ